MVRSGRLALYGAVSTILAVWTVLNAFRQRSNFYAAAVHLSQSNACMMILWNQGIFQTVMFGKLLQAVFLGELRLIEVERLQERGWFAVTETLLALTIFKDDFESTFVVLFVGLLFLKVFHWLASDRVEMMEQAAQVPRLAHARMIGLLSLLWLADFACLLYAVESIMVDGPTVMIMFASEYMILLATVWTTTMKYALHCIDMRRETPWQAKSIYVFYVELAADFFKLCTYLTFFGLILTFYGLPLNILRDVYITLRSFLLKLRDLRRYRQATRNMDELYPDATREEMDAMTDKTCIICREDMEFRSAEGEIAGAEGAGDNAQAGQDAGVQPQRAEQRVGLNDTPKKLPCGHVFHFHCLRSWLERQQSCPTCRRPVLPQEQPRQQPQQPHLPGPQPAGFADAGGPDARPDAPGAPPPPQDAVRQAQINFARNVGREAFGILLPGIPFPPEAEGPAARLAPPPPTVPPTVQAGTDQAATAPTGSTSPPSAGDNATAAAGPSISSTSLSADSGTAHDNPLARFNLSSLPLPETGEGGLYHAPPTMAYPTPGSSASFADLAYGSYPQFVDAPLLPPPPAGSAQARAVPPNLLDRIELIRKRWQPLGAAGGEAVARVESNSDANGAGADEKDKPKVDKGKGKAVETESAVDEDTTTKADEELTPREAALRAAERRAGKQPASTPSRPLPVSDPSDETIVRAVDVPQKEPSSSPTRPTAPPGPVTLPRLIPLFDTSNPPAPSLPSATLPSLRDVLTPSPDSRTTSEQFGEVDELVRRGLEERLRLLVGFQDRIELLVGDMRTALGMNLSAGGTRERGSIGEEGEVSAGGGLRVGDA
ncbi:E3 ubiquitin-protein ligase synoviolin [Rhodotorula toruloides]|uniref:RING-type E3 ubiquitin transferase n=1 Tax=Rhodotorula toruloides TaxID=5286 RepID=A0A511KHF9_RHOTO|nr:E3 ubiquitin-protein ligase synoviolin [Rhodotorula toruloides]